MTSQIRRKRRMYLKKAGFLNLKGKLPLNKWLALIKEGNQRGKDQHEKYSEEIQKNAFEKLEMVENRQITTWESIGYNKSEIAMLRDANALITLKNRETWKEDKKKARQLMKDARSSMLTRIK